MRLINAKTLKLELFNDPVPAHVPYAILSHTWSDDEETFQDIQDLSIARSKAGFSKLAATCKKALAHDLDYVWVDTSLHRQVFERRALRSHQLDVSLV